MTGPASPEQSFVTSRDVPTARDRSSPLLPIMADTAGHRCDRRSSPLPPVIAATAGHRR
jgi:hypothetical protein